MTGRLFADSLRGDCIGRPIVPAVFHVKQSPERASIPFGDGSAPVCGLAIALRTKIAIYPGCLLYRMPVENTNIRRDANKCPWGTRDFVECGWGNKKCPSARCE